MNKCYARGCTHPVQRGVLMCSAHWFLVSDGTRARVYREWSNVRRGGGLTDDYIAAINQARAEVAEYSPVQTRQPDLLAGAEKWEAGA